MSSFTYYAYVYNILVRIDDFIINIQKTDKLLVVIRLKVKYNLFSRYQYLHFNICLFVKIYIIKKTIV